MCECNTLKFTHDIQDGLWRGGGLPIIGIVPSATQAVVSVVELIVGLAALILFSPFFPIFDKCCPNNSLGRSVISGWHSSLAHLQEGALYLGLSLSNVVTLGILAFQNQGFAPRRTVVL